VKAREENCEPWHYVIVPCAAATPSSREDEARQPPRRPQDATRISLLLVRHRDGYSRPGCLAGERQAEDVRPTR